ncbi:MAG: hypothetical protein LBF25_03375, partial [Puniceicoccales bacterium]|nr:hypothetical protein [Puniceicoccales bacterium]
MGISPEKSQIKTISSRAPLQEVIWEDRVIKVVTVMAVAGGIVGYRATSDFRGAIMGIVAGAALGIVVGIYIEHPRNLGERQTEVVAEVSEGDENDHQAESPSHKQSEETGGEVVDEAPTGTEVVAEVPEADEDDHQAESPSHKQSERTGGKIDENKFDTGMKNLEGDNIIFAFSGKNGSEACTTFIGQWDTLSPADQTTLAAAICRQAKPRKIELDLTGRRVGIDIKALRKDAQGNVLVTIQKFESAPAPPSAPRPLAPADKPPPPAPMSTKVPVSASFLKELNDLYNLAHDPKGNVRLSAQRTNAFFDAFFEAAGNHGHGDHKANFGITYARKNA